MAESDDRDLAPELRRVIEELRRPRDVGGVAEERVLAVLRERTAPVPRRGWGHIAAVGGLALAAGLAAMALIRPAPAPATKGVRFTITAAAASRVAVVGDFNDWNPSGTPLLRERKNGEWSVTLPLPPGRYRFAFLLDGRIWLRDPRLPAAPDPDFGTPTSVITVEHSAL